MKRLLQSALRAIEHAILTGPIRYASGALQVGTVFSFEADSRRVVARRLRASSADRHWMISLGKPEVGGDPVQFEHIASGHPLISERRVTQLQNSIDIVVLMILGVQTLHSVLCNAFGH